jgi:hypothetical protein
MKILAIGKNKPGTTKEQFDPHLKAESRRVWELIQAGTLREIYFHQDSNDAYLIMECENSETARAAANSLPLAEEGLIEFEIIPLRPYAGLERLFA